MVPSDNAARFVIIATIVLMVGVCLLAADLAHHISNSAVGLGEEVVTTVEYDELFGDSFSGRIVMIDGAYTVRNITGTERSFERKWLDRVDAEGGI